MCATHHHGGGGSDFGVFSGEGFGECFRGATSYGSVLPRAERSQFASASLCFLPYGIESGEHVKAKGREGIVALGVVEALYDVAVVAVGDKGLLQS